MEKRHISIVIPFYNEENNIPLIYMELKKILNNANYSFEIIFVNDGSTDNSRAEVVVGVRNKNKSERLIKKAGSYLFYLTINAISETEITPSSTDYRLLDR